MPEQATIDDFGGKERVYRHFTFYKDPAKFWRAIEYYKNMEKFMKQSLYDSGLTTDDNEPPLVLENEKAVMVRLCCKASGRRISVYSGMKHEEGMIHKVKGIPIVSHKTDNTGQFLRENNNGQN